MHRLRRLLAVVAVVTLAGLCGAIPAPAQLPPPALPGNLQPGDPFGEEVTLEEKTIVYLSGTATWDQAFETIVDALKTVYGYLEQQGLQRTGAPMTIYTATDDSGFEFYAAVPVAEPPKEAPKGDIAVGKSPSGRAFKFLHRGSYDAMDTTYEAITNFLDERQLDARELFIEQYVTDPVTTADDRLVIEVYVPVK